MRALTITTAAVLVAACLGLALSGSPAAAQGTNASHYGNLRDHCVGTRIESHPIVNRRGRPVGHTELWYSPIAGGQNCVMTYNRAGSPWTRARIWRLASKGGLATAASGDEGAFQHYAGGSYVNGANRKCVTWGGSVGNFSWYSSAAGVHCG
jgi:hypothetical protein